MPLRGLKHFLPYSRQVQSVHRRIKISLENSAGSADNAFCISSFSNLQQAKTAACRRPGGGGGVGVAGEAPVASFNKGRALQPPRWTAGRGVSLGGIIPIWRWTSACICCLLVYVLTDSVPLGHCLPTHSIIRSAE